MNRADEVIERLQAEIVKRDARIAEYAQDIERLRLNIADYNEHERCYQAEIAALKAQQPSAGVVLPERDDSFGSAELDEYANGYRHGWNAYRDAAKDRLNAGRAVAVAVAVPDGYVVVPINLTENMYSKCHLATRVVAQVWRDLLAAAPSAPSAPSAQQKESSDE